MKNLMRKIAFAIIVLTAIYKLTSYSQASALGINQIPENDKNSTYKNFKLYQNEPLEFKNVTNIRFELFKAGNVNLDVYDTGGELVQSLAEGEMEPGNYNVNFKSFEGLAPGEYFYVLKFNGTEKVMRMYYSKI